MKQNKNVNKTSKSSLCPLSARCGGCQYIDKSNEEQLDIKLKEVRNLLKNYGEVETILGMEEPFHYRNKVNAAFRRKRNGEIIAGTYEEGTHNVLPVTSCLIENKKAGEIISTIKDLLRSFKITVYNSW